MNVQERQLLGYMVRRARVKQFRTVKAAKEAAAVNTATWNRVEEGERVRDDSLAAVLQALWPDSGGDPDHVIGHVDPAARVDFFTNEMIKLEQRSSELHAEIEYIELTGSNPRGVEELRQALDLVRSDLAVTVALRSSAAEQMHQDSEPATVGAASKDADSLLYRRPDGVSDQEWERIRDQSRDYIEWLIDKAARER